MNRHPSKRTWVRIVTEEAKAAGVDPVAVMAGSVRPGFAPVRWRAWRRLVDAPQGYSLAGIGKVSGFHWSAVMYGVHRLAGVSPREIYLRGMHVERNRTNAS